MRRGFWISIAMLIALSTSGCPTTQQRLLDSDVDQLKIRSIQTRAFDTTDRKAVLRTLADFLKANNLKADWGGIENAPNEALVNALAMMSPYGPAEKQAMLEAPDLKTRAEILVAITEIELAKGKSPGETSLQ